MLRRKPSNIEVKIEDKEELEEARRSNTANATNTSNNSGAAALIHQFDRAKDFSSKAHQNLFFDGAGGELSARRAVIRVRFFDDDARCVVSLKAKAILVNGVSRVEEDEEDLDPKIGRYCVAGPGKLDSVESRVLRRVKDEFGVVGEKAYVGLGGFRNLRSVYEWKGLKLKRMRLILVLEPCKR
ncbi:hypothetical protein L6164_011460 [Bauhinia variegata]|uniref:Uncharacterized protein n=1 Tax=Bauhinia variegata TaxID=167791 RepID=A0ACB9P8C1_BAUVA|nr:hypothetical protein L6164_011460 [Bauhinia variegata]